MIGIIIGHSGFIGKNLTQFYGNQNCLLYLFGNQNDILISVDKKDRIIRNGRFTLQTKWNLKTEVDFVIYLISNSTHGNDQLNHEKDLINHSLKLFVKKKTKFIFFSSAGGIYENSRILKTEDMLLNPSNDYEKTKVFLEQHLNKFTELRKNILIVRPSNIYGQYQERMVNKNGLITTLIYNAIYSKKTVIPANYKNIYRDYLHVSDLIILLAKAIKMNIYGTYNFSYGSSFSIENIIKIIHEESQKLRIPLEVNFILTNESSKTNSFISNQKIKSSIGSQPETDIVSGIRKQIIFLNELISNTRDIKA